MRTGKLYRLNYIRLAMRKTHPNEGINYVSDPYYGVNECSIGPKDLFLILDSEKRQEHNSYVVKILHKDKIGYIILAPDHVIEVV